MARLRRATNVGAAVLTAVLAWGAIAQHARAQGTVAAIDEVVSDPTGAGRFSASRLTPHHPVGRGLQDLEAMNTRSPEATMATTARKGESGTLAAAGGDWLELVGRWFALMMGGLPLVVSLGGSAVFAIRRRQRMRRSEVMRSAPPVDFERECRRKLATAVGLWRSAEGEIFELDDKHPMRTLLLNELGQISRRLSMRPALDAIHAGAVALNLTPHYWRVLHRDITRAVRELTRIANVAKAANSSMGSRSSIPQVPKDLSEAYFVLGVNPDVSEDTLKRLVRALRQCWHPDVAQNDNERSYREARIRQINVANDLIAKRVQMSA